VSGLDPIALQVLVGGMRAACDEMGATLIRSAYSTNIKERHDCSTALFNAGGELVMQAEHIPVHLGSMPDAVAAVIDEEQRPGLAWILNDPYRGGTHLPDVTLISPVFVDGELLGFAASRAHHADIGGPTPGGMPAFSKTLDEEGVVIPPTRVEGDVLEQLAARMRSPRQRLADLRAQQAANRIGETRLAELASRHGAAQLRAAPGPPSPTFPTASTAPRMCSRTTATGSSATPSCESRRRSKVIGCDSTSPAPIPRSRATSTARSR